MTSASLTACAARCGVSTDSRRGLRPRNPTRLLCAPEICFAKNICSPWRGGVCKKKLRRRRPAAALEAEHLRDDHPQKETCCCSHELDCSSLELFLIHVNLLQVPAAHGVAGAGLHQFSCRSARRGDHFKHVADPALLQDGARFVGVPCIVCTDVYASVGR